jgi:hypothetical protein
MADKLTNEQLRAISPFFVKDTEVLLLDEGQFKEAIITLNSDENAAFASNASDWEKGHCPLITGNNTWKPIIDSSGTIVAYTAKIDVTGVFHLVVRDVNGEVVVDQIVGEKPLENDELGNTVLATIVTLGGSLVVRSIAAGIGRVIASAGVAGARIATLAVSRVVSGEATEGVILTALRSIRAQSIVKGLQARGLPVVVNVGGEAGTEEVMKWGANQIALNHQVRMGVAKRIVQNLVKENGEKIGEVFQMNSINKIVSRRLDASFDVVKFSRGAFRVLKNGGQLEMELYSNNPAFAQSFIKALTDAGFKNPAAKFNTIFTAVK